MKEKKSCSSLKERQTFLTLTRQLYFVQLYERSEMVERKKLFSGLRKSISTHY